jgi:N-acetylmuramoyl-L-alanine amidase
MAVDGMARRKMGSLRGRAEGLAFRKAIFLALLICGTAVQAAGQVPVKADIGGDGEHTRYVAFLSKHADFRIFSIGDPYRIVVDLPETDIQVPAGGRGLVLSSRSGRLAAGKSRIVIDLAEPAVVDKSVLLPPENGLPARLVIELTKSTHKAFLEQSKAPPPLGPEKPAQVASQDKDTGDKRPLIVIDPGHGGVDAGAHGHSTATPEKDVTLEFCKVLKQKLEETGKFRIAITRTTDDFVALDDRAQMASGPMADLLVSVHADALDVKKLGEKNVQEVRGGTVYTLSETASDEQAKLLAQDENKADLKAGIGSELSLPATVKAEISSILGELESRGKKNRSLALSNYLIGHMKGKMKFNLRPQRGANLRVLKAAGVPAVLIELGYLSNIEDEKLLTSPEWRAKTAAALATALSDFMTERQTHIPL